MIQVLKTLSDSGGFKPTQWTSNSWAVLVDRIKAAEIMIWKRTHSHLSGL